MDPRVHEVLRHLEANYSEHLLVGRLAARVGLSRSRFEHLFKPETGTTVKAYLRRVRLLAASDLLGDWTLSVKEVAARVGYTWPSDLTRDFRKQFGMTPSRWRKDALSRGGTARSPSE
ncbi:MAG: helix-turn-helix domain-containing protein [Terriglobia bacterium]